VSNGTKRFYVYAIMVDGVVKYIGKGTGPRARFHRWFAVNVNRRRKRGEKVRTTKFYNRLAKALLKGAVVNYEILAWFETDDEAFAAEIAEIASRRGLWNKHEGGWGFNSANSKRLSADPRIKAMRREVGGRIMSAPGHIEKMQAGRLRPEAKEKFKASMAPFWGSERHRQIAVANGTKHMADAENRKAASERLTKLMAGRGKEIIAASNRRRMLDPVQAERTRAVLAAARDRNNKDPKFQAKQRAGVQAYWLKKREERGHE
jgi:hypothetical protein